MGKFNVGDKVRVDPQYGSNVDIGFGNNVGIVKAVGSGDVLADFKDGGVVRVPIAYCSKATNACANAKFKVGDLVVNPSYSSNPFEYGRIQSVYSAKSKKWNELQAIKKGDWYLVHWKVFSRPPKSTYSYSETVEMPESQMKAYYNADRSTNPVVNAAVSYAEVSGMLKLADGCVDGGDLAEAKEILRETKSAASRTGLASEWKRIAAKAGVK